MSKTCPKCGRVLPETCFSKSKGKKDGLKSHCKECIKAHYQANKTAIAIRKKEYYESHRTAIIKRARDYYIANKGTISNSRREYSKRNKDKLRKYRELHRDSISRQAKKYREEHKKEIAIAQKSYRNKHREETRAYVNERRASDVNVRLAHSLRNRCFKALRGMRKSNNTEMLLGCTWNQARLYIEKQFKDGMNWDNWGLLRVAY